MEARSASHGLDSLFYFLTLVLLRMQVGELVFETVSGLSICALVLFLMADHEMKEVLFCFVVDLFHCNGKGFWSDMWLRRVLENNSIPAFVGIFSGQRETFWS